MRRASKGFGGIGLFNNGKSGEEGQIRSRTVTLRVLLGLCVFGLGNGLVAQTTPIDAIHQALSRPVEQPAVTTFQIQSYLFHEVSPLPAPKTAAAWTKEERQLRHRILDNIAQHGWPRSWFDSPPRFQQVGVIKTGDGYQIRKLRFEVVPGMMSTALLYEPDHLDRRAPAILNLVGHEPEGIDVPYEQIRCINFAKRGIVALDLEWMGYGELSQPGNDHDFGADLDLVGANDFGLFYLTMRRGLDYLVSLPEVDPARLGVTGLSGGGWQTVILGALDPRVAISVEVAGAGSPESNLTHPGDLWEVEEGAPDIIRGRSYPEFIAMRAPKPTLLIHNAVDSCCFRAPLVKLGIFNKVKPFFQLYGKGRNLAWHENFHPGVHNYQLDNRQQAYRFFTEHFDMPVTPKEIFSSNEVRTDQELAIGVPADNLTILSLAKQFASEIHPAVIPPSGSQRDAWSASERRKLASVIRYAPVSTVRSLRVDNGVRYNFETLSYRFDFSNGLSASGIWFREDSSSRDQPVTIVLNDNGYRAATQDVYARLVRGEQVLAFDPFFIGSGAPNPYLSGWTVLLDAMGGRALGIESAQLVATAEWLQSSTGVPRIRVVTNGIRSQVIALAAAAMDPGLFSDIVSRHAMKSLAYLIDKPVPFRSAPELFCLDLYKDFDISSLSAIASPVDVSETSFAKP